MAPNAIIGRENPLQFMEKLSPEISIYRPTLSDYSDGSSTQPKLIIIASWTDALDVHIAKYVVKYQELFPSSQILLVKSTTALFFRPQLLRRAVLPAASVIRSVFPPGTSNASNAELLIHIFSNGGSSSLATLYDAYAASADNEEDTRLPQHITILDSTPSFFAAKGLVAFFQVGQSIILRTITTPILYLIGYTWGALVTIGILTDWLSVWRNAHNDPTRNQETRRVYIYSEMDALVDYRAVLSHANDAEKKGFEVTVEKFKGSAHVSHMRKSEKRYWEVVQEAWEGKE